jgi:hypothetical protein
MMNQYLNQVKDALLKKSPLTLPTYLEGKNMWDYTDEHKNILIIGSSLMDNQGLIDSCPYNVQPMYKDVQAYKDLKKYKDWADLIIVTTSPSADMDFNRDLYKRLYRTLKKHGQLIAAITLSDEVSQESTTIETIEESDFFSLLEYQKYHGIALIERAPWPTYIENTIEFREFIITAFKGKEGTCYEEGHAVIYTGPFKEVTDDGGHTLFRGKRMAVCEKTFKLLTTGPYKNCIIGLEPYHPINDSEPVIFDCTVNAKRSARKTKGLL